MTALLLLAIFIAVLSSAAGQILFKLAMNQTNNDHWQWRNFLPVFGAGIATMAVGFFLWLGLMSRFDLSYLYPFEGLDRLLLAFAAVLILKEKLTPSLLLGILMITAGILLVSMS